MNNPVLQCEQLEKNYLDGRDNIAVIRGVEFALGAGEAIAIVGASGSGKTTLLNLLAGLDTASKGSVKLGGVAWESLSDKGRSKLRNLDLGFVYQFHHLLPEFSALENVMMPMLIKGIARKKASEEAQSLLTSVGLAHRLHHRPSMLSGGERQRVAIARALANHPKCVLMDEPTGNLDETTSLEIQSLIGELKRQYDMAFVVVTHDERMLGWMDRAYRLTEGRLALM